MERLPTWLILAFTAVAVTTCMAIVAAPKTQAPVTSVCTSIESDAVLKGWKALRVVRDVREIGRRAIVEVNTRQWAEIDRKHKIAIAYAAYCKVADGDGSGSARVEGSLQEDLGAVVDGVWSR